MEEPVRVLYVDDDVQSLKHRAQVLEKDYDFEVITATNATEGKSVIENHPIDCILCDLKMPGCDGFEFYDSIQDDHPNVPFILFTAHESGEIVKEAYEAGMTDYFPKSALNISYDILAHRIHQVVQQSRQDERSETATHLKFGTPGGSVDPETDDLISHEVTRQDATTTGSDEEIRDLESRSLRRFEGGDGDESRRDTLFEMIQESIFRHQSDNSDIEDEFDGDVEANFGQPTVDPEYFRSKSDHRGRRSTLEGSTDLAERRDGEPSPTTGDVDDELLFSVVRDALVREGDRGTATPIDSETTTSSRTDSPETNGATVSTPPQSPMDRPTLDDLSRDDLLDLLEPLLSDRGSNESKDADASAEHASNQMTSESTETTEEHALDEDKKAPDETQADVGSHLKNSERVETGGDSTQASRVATDSVSDLDSASAHDVAQDPGRTTSVSETELDTSRDSAPTDAFSDAWVASTDFRPPEDLNVDAGDNVLVKCESRDDRKDAACTHLMGLEDEEAKNVLLVRYTQVDEPTLVRIANGADRVKLISIGYAQPVPDRLDETVEIIKINNPNDLTRLGIVVTGTIDGWRTAEAETVVCFDPLDVLLRYKNVQSVFRFLHIFLGRLRSGDAISHFHIDPTAEDPQEINTLKPLFDAVLSIDSLGAHLE